MRLYTCTWASAGSHTITFDGSVTGYGSGISVAAISFYFDTDNTNVTKIASISGNLYNLFPSKGTGNNQIPHFYQTFYGATNLTAIPAMLFNGYTKGVSYMFHNTFYDCTSLETLPGDLFENITTGAASMFEQAFYGCTSLQSLPAGFFASFTTGRTNMFGGTFSGCSNLSGYIPTDFFAGLITNNATYETNMMSSIFSGTGLDTSCPLGMTKYETIYDSYWSNKVSCTQSIITINWNGAKFPCPVHHKHETKIY